MIVRDILTVSEYPRPFAPIFARSVYSKTANLCMSCAVPPGGKNMEMKQKFRKTPTNRRGNYHYYNAKGELVITLSPDPKQV